jgi:hypothetical protein
MKPIDYRNATWDQVRGRLAGLRQATYEAYLRHGPGTTREIAGKSGISIFTLRPRTTELLDLNFVEVIDLEGHASSCPSSREAVYAAIPLDAAQRRFEWLKSQPIQAELKLA